MKKNITKKISLLLLGALMLCCLTGCAKKEETANDRLSAIKAKGEITIAMEGTWALGPTMMRPTPWLVLT